ncbi:MarR family transcriptional regulator [Marinobacteraceae bacterium S3BR75-40.1]
MSQTSPHFGFILADCARLQRRYFDRRAKGTGLSRAQWSVLAQLSRHEGLKQAELAELLELQPISLARHIDRLEAQGCVERRPDPQDRRARRLFLTDKAGPLLDQLQCLGQEVREQALAGLDEEQRRLVHAALSQVRDNLSHSLTRLEEGH